MTLLQSLFRQKALINEEFFAVIGRVDAEAQTAERHALIRLMNHIYVVDRIFAGHLRGEPGQGSVIHRLQDGDAFQFLGLHGLSGAGVIGVCIPAGARSKAEARGDGWLC